MLSLNGRKESCRLNEQIKDMYKTTEKTILPVFTQENMEYYQHMILNQLILQPVDRGTRKQLNMNCFYIHK